MEPQEDAIVDIPKDRVKFFGGTGKENRMRDGSIIGGSIL
jgi:hypothetical protein